jgi:hypothetical protein
VNLVQTSHYNIFDLNALLNFLNIGAIRKQKEIPYMQFRIAKIFERNRFKRVGQTVQKLEWRKL